MLVPAERFELRPTVYKTGEIGARRSAAALASATLMIDPNPTIRLRPAATPTPAPAPGSIPDFLDEALVPLDAELDDDIHQE